ncbi:hypothetical protein LTR94_034589, partial [Friedmanniomyces endolithicus]
MRRQPERRRTCRAGMEQRRTVEMGVADRTGPDRRQRHQMREIQGVDDRLPDVRIDLTWQRRQPRLDRVDAFSYRREAEPVDDPFDPPDLVLDAGA